MISACCSIWLRLHRFLLVVRVVCWVVVSALSSTSWSSRVVVRLVVVMV